MKQLFPILLFLLGVQFEARSNGESNENGLSSQLAVPGQKLDFSELEKILNREIQGKNFGNMSPVFLADDDLSSQSGFLNGPIETINRARSVIATIRQTANFIEKFEGGDAITLPIGISRTLGNVTYTMGIGSIKLKPDHAELEVYVEIEIPGKPSILFGASNIIFTKEGGIASNVQLKLLGDFAFNIFPSKSVLKLKASANPNEGTYVKIDCEGFKELNIDAEVIFSRDWIKPAAGGNGRVTGVFRTNIASIHDLIIGIDLEPFVINGLEDVTFELDHAVFDFSELKSDPSITPPSGYSNPIFGSKLWKGFYVAAFKVRLPKRLTGSQEDVRIDGTKIIIDNMGFSGLVDVTFPILPLNQGNLDGWAFSIDNFHLEVYNNSIGAVGMGGKINVPIINSGGNDPSPDDCFGYTATIALNNVYSFTVTSNTDYNVNLWKATLSLEASTLDLVYQNGKVKATAILTGDLLIDDEFGGLTLDLPELHFENLQISNEIPRFNPGLWEITGGISGEIGSFGLEITAPTIVPETGEKVNFKVGALITIATGNVNISSQGGFTIKGKMEADGDGRQRWVYDEFRVDDIELQANFSGVTSVHGSLHFYYPTPGATPDFGKGFRGMVNVDFKGLGVEVTAIGQFGTVTPTTGNQYNYFYVDVLAEFNPGIAMGGVQLMGIGGGIYRHMTRPSVDEIHNLFSGQGGQGNGLPPTPGGTLSGIVYTPDAGVELGFKATVILAVTGTSSGFNANLTLGMEFGSGMSLDRIYFEGNGRFMEKIKFNQAPSPNANNNAVIGAYVLIDCLVDAQVLDANIEVNVQVGSILTGSGSARMHFDKGNNQWYIKVGEPSNPNFFNVYIPFVPLGIQLKNYFMMGNYDIEGVPTPNMPPNILSHFLTTPQGSPPELWNGEEFRGTEHTNGGGFAFGANVGIETGDKKFGPVAYSFGGGLGFDISIRDFGHTLCDGSVIGINGWYAEGQAYAYVHGDVGLEAKVFGKKRSFKVVSLNAGLLVEAKLPNPFWAQGRAYIEWNFLNGVVKGDLNMKVTLGDECENIVTEPQTVDVVKAITPVDGAQNVSLFAKVRIEYNVLPTTEYKVESLNGTETYRVMTESLSLSPVGLFTPIWVEDNIVEYNIGDAHTSLSAKANKSFTLIAKYKFQMKNAAGLWEDIMENGEVVYETHEIHFTTGENPSYVPEENVLFGYPINRQLYFHEDVHNQGCLALKQGQAPIFYLIPTTYGRYVRFIRNTDQTVAAVVPLENGSTMQIPNGTVPNFSSLSFVIPKPELNNNEIYKLEIVVMPKITTNNGGGDVGGGNGSVPYNPASPYTSLDNIIRQLTFTGAAGEIQSKTQQVAGMPGVTATTEQIRSIVEIYWNGKRDGIIRPRSRQLLSSSNIEDINTSISSLVTSIVGMTGLTESEEQTEKITREEWSRGVSILEGLSTYETNPYPNLNPWNDNNNPPDIQALISGNDIYAIIGGTNPGPGPGPITPDFPTEEEYGAERVLYTMYFRTSNFNNFVDKINSMIQTPATYADYKWSMNLQSNNEVFDAFELMGENGLIRTNGMEGSDDGVYFSPWYLNTIRPLIYNNFKYPVTDCGTVDISCNGVAQTVDCRVNVNWRDDKPFGFPPKRATGIQQTPNNLKLTDTDIQSNSIPSYHTNIIPTLTEDIPAIVYNDYVGIRNAVNGKQQILGNIVSGCDEYHAFEWWQLIPEQECQSVWKNISDTSFPDLPAGTYTVKLRYFVPITSGGMMTTNTVNLNLTKN